MNNSKGPVIQIQNEQYQSTQQMYQRQNVPQMAPIQSHMTPYHSHFTHLQSHMVPVQHYMTPIQNHMTTVQNHMAPVQSPYSYPQEQDSYEVVEEYEEEYEDEFDSRQWAGEPSFPAAEKTLTVKMPQFTVKNRPLGNISSNTAALVNKVSTLTATRPAMTTKRKATVLATAPPPAKPVSGPLRLSGGPLKLGGVKGGGVKPVARQAATSDVIPIKRTKIVKSKTVADEEVCI